MTNMKPRCVYNNTIDTCRRLAVSVCALASYLNC